MQKCKLKCNRNCNNLMMQIRLAKKMQRWDRQSSRCKKNAIGTGDCKKKTKQPPNCKKNAMWQTKCKKKRCDRQSVKKKRWNGQSAKKNAMWQTQCKKKAMWPAKNKKKAMGRAKCKKKAMERAKCKKNATVGSLLRLAFGKGSQQDETTKPRLAALVFFLCVCVSLCVWICILLCFWSNDQDSTTCPIPSFFTCQHKTPQMHDWHLFFCSLWEKEKKGTH